MKVWIRVGKIEAEATIRGAYSPDVFQDVVHRLTEAVTEQLAVRASVKSLTEPSA